jgi:hypothetical protein
MPSIEERLRRLEKQRKDGQCFVVLFGDDPAPDDLPTNAIVVRFNEEDRLA